MENKDDGAVDRDKSESDDGLAWKARDVLFGFRGGKEWEMPEAGEVADRPDADAATGSGFEGPLLSTDARLILTLSLSTRPPAGVCCCRDLTSSVPAPYVGTTAVLPAWSVTNQT